MKVLVIGAVDFSLHCLEVLSRTSADIVGVVTTSEPSRYSDYADLEPLSGEHGWCFKRTADINSQETRHWIQQRRPDVVFCVGWSQLIKRPLLGLAPKGVIGAHPSLLPYNRGRHPLIWALALGLKKTGLTFFQMDEGADSGDILVQVEIPIDAKDDAQSLYDKVKSSASPLLTELYHLLETDRIQAKPQVDHKGNLWRKRSKKDGRIDWRMSTQAIDHLVRALHHPYPGATTSYGGTELIVWQVESVDLSDIESEVTNHEPGKIVALQKAKPIVKTFDGLLKLKQTEPVFDFTPETYMD